ncbi:sulfotransferase domain-containing protein [Sulfitobacter pontiacus]|uniref:sulfotransferase domain-containing protein n=1 Tax=Sulfitobacter pontiacus TaxID=60137 RepID=UPI0030EBB502
MNNVILLWRDGRDIMVSYYYYRLFQPRHKSSLQTEQLKKVTGITDPENIQENLPNFIEYCMTTPDYPRFSWPEFVADWVDRRDVLHLSYERLLTDAAGSLTEALNFIGEPLPDDDWINEVIEKHSFAAKTRRKPGEEDKQNFLRKGIAGDWRNKFSDEAIEVFDHYAGDALARLGYAPSRSSETVPVKTLT